LVVTLVYLEFAFLKGLFSQKYLLKDFGESWVLILRLGWRFFIFQGGLREASG
jgi:hypothetical protein